jgi:pyrroline-5-carboxylate reductase
LEPQRDKLARPFGVQAAARPPTAAAGQAGTVVWAVKPQSLCRGRRALRGRIGQALQLSVMAGIRSDAIVPPAAASASCAPCPTRRR